MGSKSSPKAPDYTGAAREQSEASKDITQWQTFANRPNMNTPWGTSQWSVERGIDPTTGKPIPNWTQDINLSPEQQKAFDDQQAIQGGRSELAKGLLGSASQEMQTPGDFWNTLPDSAQTPDVPSYGGNLPGMGAVPNPSGAPLPDRGQAPGQETYTPESIQRGLDFSGTQALDAGGGYNPDFAQTQYDRQMSLEGPRMERQREALDVRLRNQGLRPGTQAYDQAMLDQRNQQGEQTSRMSQDAMRLGADEQQRQFGRELGSRQQGVSEIGQQGGFANQAANQALGQQLGIGGQRFGQGMMGGQFSDAQRAQAQQEQQQQFGREMGAGQYQDQQRQQAGQEQLAFGGQQFGQQMQQGQMQQQQRQNAIAEQLQQEGWSLNKINAALSGQQVGMPAFPNTAMGAAQQSQAPQYLNAANMQGQYGLQAQQNAQAPWAALGNIGGSVLGGMATGGTGLFAP